MERARKTTVRSDGVERPRTDRFAPDHPDYAAALAAHRRAVDQGAMGYLDPSTGLFVMTAAHLRDRGWCCDRGCRHCPYEDPADTDVHDKTNAEATAAVAEAEEQPMSDRIHIERIGGVADVRLNRPEKMNALDPDMFTALVDTSAELAEDASLRCVVLSGEGRSFCAGLDFSGFQGMSEASPRPEGNGLQAKEGSITHRGQQAVYGWTSLPVPVIAAVHGHALGGGIQLALGADIRIVAPDAKLSVLEIRWGLVPDMTGTQALVNLVGLDVAKELTFTGRTVSGEEAVALGLCTRVAEDPHAEAMALAEEIAQKSPDAVRGAKRLFNAAPKDSTADGFAREREEIGQLIGSPNQTEQIKAFFEKRTPNFADPTS